MSKVARMRWGALFLGSVAPTPGHASTRVRRTPGNGLLGAGFTSSNVMTRCRTVLVMLLVLAAAPAWTAGGRTPGSFDVSSTGEAQYSIPIFAPPGINGLAPELALTYGHRHEGTLAGVGWGVSGLSAIHRCEKTWAQNGVASAPQNALDDRYCLDGNQLRLFSGTYGQSGSTYRTEIETYSRITALGAAGDGPASFKVELKNGLIYEYGNNTNSRILSLGQLEARAWAVNKISDRSGNQINVTWHNDTANGSYRIDHVDYATNTIDFQWESKPVGEVKSGYVTGSQVREIHRLQAIEVQQGGAALRRYEVTYEGPLSTTSRSRLASIEECAGSTCRPPTTFAYQNGSAGLQGEVNTGQQIPAPASARRLDVNGDGREDLVFVSHPTSGQGTWKVMLANSSGGYGTPIDSGQSNQNYTGAIPIDHNHDGLGDVLVPYNTTWWVMHGSANGLGTLTNTSAPATTTGRGANAGALDIDGDGRQDLVWADLIGFGGGDIIKYRLRSSSGNGFGGEVQLTQVLPENQRIESGVFSSWARRHPDFNGDGRGDVAYRHTKQTWNAEINKWDRTRTVKAFCVGGGCSFSQNLKGGASDLTFGDFNGDGLTDLFYYGGQVEDQVNSSTWWHALSRGTAFEAPVPGASLNLPFTLSWVILDWDADGYDDVLAGYGTSGEWKLLRATGLGFGSWISVGLTVPGVFSALVTDLNGDGLDDFAYLQSGIWRYRKHAGVPPDLLTQITDGYGNTLSVTYGQLTASGVHTKTAGATFPEQEWQGAMTVVTEHTASDGIGGMYSVDHTYEGARIHAQGRGFEGFSRHTTVDDRNGVKTQASFLRLFPYTGSPDLTELRQSNNTLIESTDFVWNTVTPTGGVESRTRPFASKITGKTHGVGATFSGTLLTTVVTDTTMDVATGTPTEIKVATTEASGANGIRGGTTWTERTVHSQLFTNTTAPNWCVGRPQRTQQINSHSFLPHGAEETRTLATTWDAVYCRPTERVLEPDLAQWRVETDLDYDSFGNLRLQTVGDGAGPLPNRVWVTTWSADGRFPLSVKNPLNQTTQRTFDARFGLPATETDPNGLQTSFIYDGFGRQTRETRPDQTRTDWAYAVCGSTCGQVVTASQKGTTGSEIRADYVYFDNFDRLYLTRTQLLGGGYSRVERQYDDLGRLARESAPCTEGGCPSPLYWTNFSYDLIGRPTQISRPFTASTTQTTMIAYAGLRTTVTDPLGKLSIRTADGRGRLAGSADDDGYAQIFDFDAFGNPVRVTDSAGRVLQSATFNVRGLRETATDADLGAWQYAYNAFGEPISHTDANDKTTTYTWDALGRPLTRVMPESTGLITRSWIWGASAGAKEIGRLRESQVTGTGVTTYREIHAYDVKGRPAQTVYVQGADTIGLVNLAYEATSGLVDSLTYPESTAQYRLKVKYEYEKGLLKRVKDFNAPTTVFWEATTMDAYGQILDETLGNGLKTIRGIEPRTGLLNSITSGPDSDFTARQDLEYAWDKAGNLTSRQDLNQSLIEAFEYDDLYRLKRVTLNDLEKLALSYEPNGNIMTKSDLGNYTYHPTKLHAVTSISGVTTQSFSYDANGNMTGRNGGELLWFADNRAKRIRKTLGSANDSSEFQYGPDGQRWYHKINLAGTIYTHVNLGGIFEIVTKGAVDDFRHTIHANGVPIALYSRKSTGTNTLRYLLRDHLGSVDMIATSAGDPELLTSYFPFGGRRNATWDGPMPPAEVTLVRDISRRGFTDHEHLGNTNLTHMNGRVQDPVLGRFVSADPFIDGVTNTQGWNRYSYVGNNPLSYVDPSGYGAAPSADGPPEAPPHPGFGPTFCQHFGGASVCLGFGTGTGWRSDRPFARDLTWEQAFGIFHRRQRQRAGTENYMPHLGTAQWQEDLGVGNSTEVRNTIGAYVKEFLIGALEAFARAGYHQTNEFGISFATFGPEFKSPFAPAATNELQLARDLGPTGLLAIGLVAGRLQPSLGARATTTATAVSEIRYTKAGETFIRYESANPAFSRITPSGGVTPGTYAAPASDGAVSLGQRVRAYNLPSPNIPRPKAVILTPPAGTPVIGPRTVVGGTGNEVIFPLGF
jgi:RHS repeat-associated protein